MNKENYDKDIHEEEIILSRILFFYARRESVSNI